MLGRRDILTAAATIGLAAPAIAQSRKKIAFLTWNLIDQEALVRTWIKSFEAANPGAEVEWLDKKGPELYIMQFKIRHLGLLRILVKMTEISERAQNLHSVNGMI